MRQKYKEQRGMQMKSDPETALRELWTRQGVSKERQDALIADTAAKAQPGAFVGPFKIVPNSGEDHFFIAKDAHTGEHKATRGTQEMHPTPGELLYVLRYFHTKEDAQEYRHEHGTGGWIFTPDCIGLSILFPPDHSPTMIFNHQATRGLSGTLCGNG